VTPRELGPVLEALRTGIIRRPGAALTRLLEAEGVRARKGVLPPSLVRRLRNRLIQDHGVNPALFEAGATIAPPTSRTQTLMLMRDEKAGRARTRRPVLIRHQPGGELRFGGGAYRLPAGSALHIDAEEALRLEAEGVILVENWEPFFGFDKLDFPVPARWRAFPLLFRGDPGLSSQADVERVLRSLDVPVISFPDYDPAGLGAGLAAPGVTGLLWPGADRLRSELATHKARRDRYLSQVGQYRVRLDAATGAFAEAWAVIRDTGAGLMQEAFLYEEAFADFRGSE
jgi:hypothetical protein